MFEESQRPELEVSMKKTKCWAGFSSSLGDFEQEDEADPCHYGKLFHQAMGELKAENKKQSTSSVEFTASPNYLLFLSQQLEQRRVDEKISLYVELGKSELRQLNYLSAQNRFDIAHNILSSSAHSDPKILAELLTLSAQIKAALKE